ncbi:MAG TPA: 6-phosphogluconolactonase [Thermomicrobiaceae bacterium]|nr:6-phosphogluconolactonase [Thermomicrobiaceae bacterium]
MSNPEVVVVPDATSLAREAARRVVDIARDQIGLRGRLTLALSGGSTPRALFRLLAAPSRVGDVDWSRVHVFWGDERTVPPDDDESNYRMAREALLDHVPVPPEQVHRILAENRPDEAAAAYEQVLREVFGLAIGEPPDFGLMLLGIGADGHTASLFPGTRALEETDRLVVANVVPQLGTTRITVTVPVITEAANILVLVAGADKADAVQRALEAPYDPGQTPSQILRTAAGRVAWLLDEAAAAGLDRRPG